MRGTVVLLLCIFSFLARAENERVVVHPKPSSEVLINPGKGWVLYGRAEWQDPKVMAVGGLAYHRFEWRELEPADGQFNWKPIDEFLAGWEKAGKQASFGVMCCNSHAKDPYVTPKWVFDAGAKFRLMDMKGLPNPYAGTPGKKAVPEFFDPVFTQKLRALLTALANRYDGDERVAFIDIRSYGNWGEGHMYPFGGKGLTSDEYRQQVQWHLDVFKKTRLCISAEGQEHTSVYDWAVKQGVAARRDGICGNSNGSETARAFGISPGVFEFYGAYTWMKEQGWWDGRKDKNGDGHTLDECIQNGKPSYIGLSQGGQEALKFLEAERPLITRVANQMGYHFVLREALLPGQMTRNAAAKIGLTWINEGVAPIYVPCNVALALIDENNTLIDICFPSECRPAAWMPAKENHEEASAVFMKSPPGEYTLAIGLVRNPDGVHSVPWIKLGIDGRTTTGWYPLSRMKIVP